MLAEELGDPAKMFAATLPALFLMLPFLVPVAILVLVPAPPFAPRMANSSAVWAPAGEGAVVGNYVPSTRSAAPGVPSWLGLPNPNASAPQPAPQASPSDPHRRSDQEPGAPTTPILGSATARSVRPAWPAQPRSSVETPGRAARVNLGQAKKTTKTTMTAKGIGSLRSGSQPHGSRRANADARTNCERPRSFCGVWRRHFVVSFALRFAVGPWYLSLMSGLSAADVETAEGERRRRLFFASLLFVLWLFPRLHCLRSGCEFAGFDVAFAQTRSHANRRSFHHRDGPSCSQHLAPDLLAARETPSSSACPTRPLRSAGNGNGVRLWMDSVYWPGIGGCSDFGCRARHAWSRCWFAGCVQPRPRRAISLVRFCVWAYAQHLDMVQTPWSTNRPYFWGSFGLVRRAVAYFTARANLELGHRPLDQPWA